jgi:heme exporter protein C
LVDRVGTASGSLAILLLAGGLYLGLVVAPPDFQMGDVYRIFYIHLPSWFAVALAYLTSFVASVLYLFKRQIRFDHWALAGAEVGVVFNITGLITGSLWGRPTWGVYWTWDPRLTTTAIMLVTFAGYLVLRGFLEDPEARARVSALVAIVGFFNVPIVYYSVKWWRTLHQQPSSPNTVDASMVTPLRVMGFAFLFLCTYLMCRRYALADAESDAEREALQMGAANG